MKVVSICKLLILLCPSFVVSYVFFDDAMLGKPTSFGKWDKNDREWLKVFKRLYEQNNLDEVPWSDEPKIPKIIHHVWLGSEFPTRYVDLRKTWAEFHSDKEWEHRLWTDEDVQHFALTNQSAYDMSCNFGQKSDILRLEILYRFGGIYVDTDFECLGPFDELVYKYSFFAGISHTGSLNIANGLIGASPGHPILKACIDTIEMSANQEIKNNPTHILKTTGPIMFTRCFYEYATSYPRDVVALPVSFFYPVPNTVQGIEKRSKIKHLLKPESFAVHYWECSWQKRR